VILAGAPEPPTVTAAVTVRAGDGLASALRRAGVGSREAEQVTRMLAEIAPLATIRPNTRLSMTLGRRPNPQAARPLEALSLRPRLDLAVSVARASRGLTIQSTSIPTTVTRLRVQGTAGPSLFQSARAAGIPAAAVEDYLRAIAAHHGAAGFAADDRFDIILEQRHAASGESDAPQLQYAGLYRRAGADLRLLPWVRAAGMEWFDASGKGPERKGLLRPVPGRIVSGFGTRVHPILRFLRMHRGVDFQAGYGTPIRAAADGIVSAAGWAGGYGRQVRLSHSGNLETSYSHMSEITAPPGRLVRQGEVIGHVGSTGLSTGPHLHYEVTRGNVPVDPAAQHLFEPVRLLGHDLSAFRHKLAALLALPVGTTVTESR
jgi:murein DD-endopeptidase MepM/ murein hydrolase activator NlpD